MSMGLTNKQPIYLDVNCNHLSEGPFPEDHQEVKVSGPDQVLALHVVGHERVLLRDRALVFRRTLKR